MQDLKGTCILVLEDEFLIALEAQQGLEQLGAIVVGPAHTLETALKLIATTRIDAALLDLNIGGQSSEPVGQALAQRGVPFVLGTGYGDRVSTAGAAHILDKPYSLKDLAEALQRALAGARGTEGTKGNPVRPD